MAILAGVPLFSVPLHGSLGGWDEILMAAGAVVVGIALAMVLKPRRRGSAEGEESEGAVVAAAAADDQPPDGTDGPTAHERLPEARERL